MEVKGRSPFGLDSNKYKYYAKNQIKHFSFLQFCLQKDDLGPGNKAAPKIIFQNKKKEIKNLCAGWTSPEQQKQPKACKIINKKCTKLNIH